LFHRFPVTAISWWPYGQRFSLVSAPTGGGATSRRFNPALVHHLCDHCFWRILSLARRDACLLQSSDDAVNYVCFAPAVVFSMLLLVNFSLTGLASWVSQDQDREWWARSAAWILIMIFGWIAV
jgi:hypothetical protein